MELDHLLGGPPLEDYLLEDYLQKYYLQEYYLCFLHWVYQLVLNLYYRFYFRFRRLESLLEYFLVESFLRVSLFLDFHSLKPYFQQRFQVVLHHCQIFPVLWSLRLRLAFLRGWQIKYFPHWEDFSVLFLQFLRPAIRELILELVESKLVRFVLFLQPKILIFISGISRGTFTDVLVVESASSLSKRDSILSNFSQQVGGMIK